MASVLLHPDVEKKLQALPDDVDSRVRSELAEASERPKRHLKPLTNREEYALRIGKRRALIDWDRNASELRVLVIDTRDTVYD